MPLPQIANATTSIKHHRESRCVTVPPCRDGDPCPAGARPGQNDLSAPVFVVLAGPVHRYALHVKEGHYFAKPIWLVVVWGFVHGRLRGHGSTTTALPGSAAGRRRRPGSPAVAAPTPLPEESASSVVPGEGQDHKRRDAAGEDDPGSQHEEVSIGHAASPGIAASLTQAAPRAGVVVWLIGPSAPPRPARSVKPVWWSCGAETRPAT
jgi:hypothetical protein